MLLDTVLAWNPVGLLCPLPQITSTVVQLLTALIFSASFSQVDTANVDQITPNEHPHLSTNKANLIAQLSAFSWMGDKMPLRFLRLLSDPKATLCRHCEQYSVCFTGFIHFFNICQCYFSLCLVLLLVNKPDCFWATFLLWYSFP